MGERTCLLMDSVLSRFSLISGSAADTVHPLGVSTNHVMKRPNLLLPLSLALPLSLLLYLAHYLRLTPCDRESEKASKQESEGKKDGGGRNEEVIVRLY